MESCASLMPHQANLYQSAIWKLKGGLSMMEAINNCIDVLADAGDSFSATAAAAATIDDGSGPPLPPLPSRHAYETDPMRRADGVFHDNAGRAFIYDPPRYLLWVLGELKRNLKQLFPQSQVDDDGLLDEGPLYQAEDQLLELLREISLSTDDAPDICRDSLDLVNRALFNCTDMEGFLLYGYKNTEALQHARETTGFDASKALGLSQEIVKDLQKAVTLFKQNAMIEWCKGLHRAYDAEKRAGTMGAQVFGRSTRDAKTPKLPEQESASSEYENGPMPPNEIDEHLHSRQLAVYGVEAMRRLFTSNVLVSGLNGLGAEIAKNLALAGVKSVTIHDIKTVELWDLSGNFFLSEEDVGKNRAVACVAKLQDLNNAVFISSLTEELTTEHLSKFQADVFTDICLDKACEFDDYCHSHQPPISFIKSEVCGLFGSVFCDFGPKFTVLDVDGEDAHTGIIASISNDNPALVSCVDDEELEFQDGDLVVFSEVDGMKELNDGKPRKVKNARPISFSIEEDTSNFGIYRKGGIVRQVKEPKVLCFKALRDAMRDPGDFLRSDFSKFDRPSVLHLAFASLDRFKKDYERYPAAGCEQDVQSFLKIVAATNEALTDCKLDTIDEKLFRQFASGSRAVLNPMAAIFGGIVGQEILKACSGKFHPLYQFFYFDSVESLPTYPLDPQDLKSSNSRYDAQVSVFGSKLQNKLEESKTFIVGSGALGCEFLKNLVLMGVSCGSEGKVTITDDDIIEKSNLSGQFLFRDRNIGQAKSAVAATAASAINPKLHIDAFQNLACPDTESVFDDPFWEGVDVVVNAVDNVNARLYMDTRCLYLQKPLLESGTWGAKCNTQMVIPHLTENYGASRDPPEKNAPPMCRVHYFPQNIDHCLTWALSEFEGLLKKIPNEVNSFLSSPAQYAAAMRNAGDAHAREVLERVSECFDKERCTSFYDCLSWARQKFEDYFSNRVKQLTFTFPEDAATSMGAPFWSAPKRFPRALQFSAADPSHINFIMSASILRAESNGIDVPEWPKNSSKLAAAVKKIKVPNFKPRRGVNIVTHEKASNFSSTSVDDVAAIDDLVAKLHEDAKWLPPGFQMRPIQFEKDDGSNFHMDFIAGLANLRARNYSIPEVDKLNAKLIAGRTIPAIATSTAMATGLVCLELYKVIAGGHPVEHYRNTFANLALPLFTMAEPVPPKVMKHKDRTWTVWDRWSIKGNLTLAELLE